MKSAISNQLQLCLVAVIVKKKKVTAYKKTL